MTTKIYNTVDIIKVYYRKNRKKKEDQKNKKERKVEIQ